MNQWFSTVEAGNHFDFWLCANTGEAAAFTILLHLVPTLQQGFTLLINLPHNLFQNESINCVAYKVYKKTHK